MSERERERKKRRKKIENKNNTRDFKIENKFQFICSKSLGAY